jgi:tRNA G37 N-methylase Trm5
MARRINKKPKKKKGPRIAAVNPRERSSRVEALLSDVSELVNQENYQGATEICMNLLSSLPQGAPQRAEVLAYIATIHARSQRE